MAKAIEKLYGVSSQQIQSLQQICGIKDTDDLLGRGKTPGKRKEIADRISADARYVDILVKQADILRIKEISCDFAYLLVLAGVRCIPDLARINTEAAKRILVTVNNTHPGYVYDEAQLAGFKVAAGELAATDLSFDTNDPELVQLFEDVRSAAANKGPSQVEISQDSLSGKISFKNGGGSFDIELPTGYRWESTTSFKMVKDDGTTGATGRVDHPGMAGGSDSSNAGSTGRASGRVDHPGMTGGSGSSSSGSGSSSGSSSSDFKRPTSGNSSPRRR